MNDYIEKTGGKNTNLIVKFNSSEEMAQMRLPPSPNPAPFTIHTYLGGTGQRLGQIISRITNNLVSVANYCVFFVDLLFFAAIQ